MTITGTEFYRKKARMTVAELAAMTGVGIGKLHNMEKAYKPTMCASSFIKVADAFGITVDELLEGYDDSMLRPGDRVTYRRKGASEDPINCIANYRCEENLSYAQLGVILGVTRERAHGICHADVAPDKHVASLARHEQISVEEFHYRYDLFEECAA